MVTSNIANLIIWVLISYFIFYELLAPRWVIKILRKRNPGIENYTIREFLKSYYLPIPKSIK